ncbi:MmyB family transcriptional regulator [Vibrio salinus]|uniref:MmyB family transcriptional regulator n=1 Tax=Vibrio salinus TaxID=2899784 RepID=UPI001E39021D|nr:helix-turn-helix domain-containing protein [Vibrio salinus]MCE0495608.1 helix-turn-helix transcriptional regulator [Vibrio salinus]
MSEDNLKVLGEFYRRKRESLLPESMGLPKSARRSRTPGLRREDVAYLAGVSSVWYSKIERGKTKGISATTIELLNSALQLTKDEVEYVNRLIASENIACPVSPCMRLSPYSQRILDLVNPLPAMVLNDYLDIIYANSAFVKMCGVDVNELSVQERNYIHLTITSSKWRKFLNITDEQSLSVLFERLAGVMRSNQASRYTDKKMRDLIERFLLSSTLFHDAWKKNTVHKPQLDHEICHASLKKKMKFFKQILFHGSGESSGRITIYHPVDDSDYERLERILNK